MVLALLVVTAMLVTLNNGVDSLQRQVVELVEREAGEHDITLTRAETSPSQFIDIAETSVVLRAADAQVAAVYPRFHATVELRVGGQVGNASLVARAPEDTLGQVTIQEGAYDLEGDKIVLLRVTADTYRLKVGDSVDVSYILPVSRITGYERPADSSMTRVTRRFTVSGIALATGLGSGGQNGILASVATVQDWLDVPGRAERLIVKLDGNVYGSVNTQTAIFRVRRIAERLYDALGDDAGTYAFSLAKAEALDLSDVAFAVLRSVSTVYGFLVMGVVGLLLYSIINTNVEERRRDLAFLRILGAKRRHLFGLVFIEVAFIGLFGVGLGIIAGQIFSITVVAPVANHLITSSGVMGDELGLDFHMTITVAAMLRAGLTAAIVLALSAIAPARKAANTKIRYAINPGSADNIQIEDLAKLRSRKFDIRIVIAGVVLTVMWGLIFIGTNWLFVQGNESIIGAFMFTGLALLIIGVSLLFYALTIPFERLLLLVSDVLAPRLTFFAGPNLLRAKQRNTIISLMVVFSATLPTFLGTMAALEQKNYDIQARSNYGSPVTVQVSRWMWAFFSPAEDNLLPSILDDFRDVSGIADAVGVTSAYRADLTNKVTLRTTSVSLQGLTGTLDGIVYSDLAEYYAGGPEMFDIIFREPDTIILGAGYAAYMDVSVGDVIKVRGAGKDHIVSMRVVGLIERMPGFSTFSRNQNEIRWGQVPAFVSLDTYLRLTHDPTTGSMCTSGVCVLAEREKPVIARILSTTDPGAVEKEVIAALREFFAARPSVWVQSTAEAIRTTEQSMRTTRVLMLIMTALSFITSIFGVFAVVYVAVYVRRLEIGMLKAIGMRKRKLVGAFALEAVMMTVSASLAGVVAGTVLGYVFYVTNNTMRNTPTQPTFDWLTTAAILVMVVLASVISAMLAARSTVRRKVTFRLLWLLAIVLLAAGCTRVVEAPTGAVTVAAELTTAAEPTPLPVTSVGKLVVADGRLASPFPSLALGFSGGVSGEIVNIAVRAGDVIEAGDTLARLDDTDLRLAVDKAQLMLDRALLDRERAELQLEQDVADAQKSLETAQRALETSRLQYSSTTVEEARAVLERWREAEADAKRTYETPLYGDYTPDNIRESNYKAWQNAIREREFAEMRLRDTINARSVRALDIEAREQDVAQAERKLSALDAGIAPSYDRAIEDAERELAKAKAALENVVLIAPWNAIVLSVDVAPKATVGAGTPVVTLLNIEDGLRFVSENLSEQHVAALRPGQRATITLRTYPETPLEGTVEAIIPQVKAADTTNARFTVHIRLDPTELSLLPGLTGRAEILTGP
jgi:ABC-type antimicrobial peptide transport system permease subunit/multidrug efflux pump subunit AcrA (membrane-fusion protein)